MSFHPRAAGAVCSGEPSVDAAVRPMSRTPGWRRRPHGKVDCRWKHSSPGWPARLARQRGTSLGEPGHPSAVGDAVHRRDRRPHHLMSATVVTFLAAKLAVVVANLWWFPTVKILSFPATANRSRNPEAVALLVPVRDEMTTLPTTIGALLASGCDELLFLDDESTDGSGAFLRSAILAADPRGPRVRVLSGSPRPAGWAGKTWACAQLAQESTAALLVFCDCDVELAPGALAVLRSEMDRQRAEVFSIFCRQLTGSVGERLLIPLIMDVVLCLLPFGLLGAPVPAAATASGALLAFRRTAYERLGGFAAVRGEVVEDIAIARLARRLGLRLGLALGGDVAQVRMYSSYRQVVTGMGRGLVPAAGGRRWLVALGWCWHVLAYTAPVLLLRRSRWWAAAAVMGVAERLLVEGKTGGRDWPMAAAVSLSPLAAAPVVVQALRRRQTWKGRTYA